MVTLIAAVLLALGVSFCCSFIEAGLLSLSQANVADLAREDAKKGKIWIRFKSDIGKPISVILLLNTTAHTIGASVAGAKWSDLFGDAHLWIFSLVFTFLMLQYTEILPKTLGVRYRMFFARTAAYPLAWAVAACSPLISVIHWINKPFEKGQGKGQERANPIQEIDSLASMARMTNLIGRREEKIISSATHLSGTTAEQVMIPLNQVTVLADDTTIHDAFLLAHQDLHMRYPVCDHENPGRMVGYVNFKELVYFMSTNPNNPSFLGIVRPLRFVKRQTSAAELLKMFVEQHNHLVMVEDENNLALGLVTVEDVIEELVGELEDEFDRLPLFIHGLAGGVWLVGGGADMDSVGKRIGQEFGSHGTVIAEWLSGKLAGSFKPGDVHRLGRYEFAVRRVKRGKIYDVSVTDRFASRVGLKPRR